MQICNARATADAVAGTDKSNCLSVRKGILKNNPLPTDVKVK